jgi:colanic acid/amylovoran biosynthesis glycosyltransferase
VSAQPVRVLYVLKRFPQLSQTFIVRELIALEALGVEIGVDAISGSAVDLGHVEVSEVRATVRYLGVGSRLRDPAVRTAVLRSALRRPGLTLRLALRARRARQMAQFVQVALVAGRIRRDRCTHVHAHFAGRAAEIARDAALLSGCRFSVTAHARDIFHEDHTERLAARLRGAATVVTVSAFNVDHLRSRLGDTSVELVPNGMPIADVSPRPHDGPILCVARLVEKKGIDILLRAVAEQSLSDPGIAVEIVGGGELADDLRLLAASLGVSDRVRFLGPLDSTGVDAAYRRCSMFVLACRVGGDGDRDGMPTVLLEAMARALPVVSTDLIGIPEIVRDGITGLLVPADDSAALAVAIGKLRRDPELADALGAAARQMVADEFEPTRSATALRCVFAGPARRDGR